jgi:tryptophan synthase alpha chain
MVGFGIKNHEDATRIASNADGFIVGSALIDTIKKHYPNKGWEEELFSFVHSLKFGK